MITYKYCDSSRLTISFNFKDVLVVAIRKNKHFHISWLKLLRSLYTISLESCVHLKLENFICCFKNVCNSKFNFTLAIHSNFGELKENQFVHNTDIVIIRNL